jgi:DNA-binding transcriptional regulator YdaS (Cro superfamily)
MKQLKKALEWAGGVTALARALGINHSDVSKWASGIKPVAYKHRIEIERLTKGAIRAIDWKD